MPAWTAYCQGYKVKIKTNLDLDREDFAIHLVAIPRVGEKIVSKQIWNKDRNPVELKVCDVKYGHDLVEIELHLIDYFKTLNQFSQWYRNLSGISIT